MNWQRLRPYAQLARLPLVPSALADIALGALVSGTLVDHWPAFLLLLPASACLYTSGMVWNDYFDVEQDRLERPERPIPSGRVSRAQTGRLGGVLFFLGLVFAALAGWVLGSVLPLILAALLVLCILAYDGWLKRSALGPVAMGSCRFLNVMLGASLSTGLAWPVGPHVALVVGLYIVGVTWFARTEAQQTSEPSSLIPASLLMLFAFLLALPLPLHQPEGTSTVLFPYLLVALGFWIGLGLHRAIQTPIPAQVQGAVRRSLMSLVLLDATLASAVVGPIGLVILVLFLPTLYLLGKRWLYAT